MNIWGIGSFDNDSAKDFTREVVQDGDFALREAFEVVLDPDMDLIEAEEGQRAIAAAEILAAIFSGDAAKLTDAELRLWAQQAKRTDFLPLRSLVQRALERVLGSDSELPDLWAEKEDEKASAWQTEVRQLLIRLLA